MKALNKRWVITLRICEVSLLKYFENLVLVFVTFVRFGDGFMSLEAWNVRTYIDDIGNNIILQSQVLVLKMNLECLKWTSLFNFLVLVFTPLWVIILTEDPYLSDECCGHDIIWPQFPPRWLLSQNCSPFFLFYLWSLACSSSHQPWL